MYRGKLEEHLADKWVKKFVRTFDPGPLAILIEERIKWPVNTGPSVPFNTDEKPCDIISAFIDTSADFRKKCEPAIGLLLYKTIHGSANGQSDFTSGLFHLIRDNKLTECLLLLKEWLVKNQSDLKSEVKHIIDLYCQGLFTLGVIQPQNDLEMEKIWLDIWRGARAVFWAAAFSGLRKQNPAMAISELPLLVERNSQRMGDHLLAMAEDENSWPLLKKEFNDGLAKENGYCAVALNVLVSKLTTKEQRQTLIGSLR